MTDKINKPEKDWTREISPPKPLSIAARTTLLLLGLLIAWFFSELGTNIYYQIRPPELQRFLIGDQFDQALHFDPVRGRNYTSIPTRTALFANGTLEYLATQRGNSQGFPDRDDFGPQRDLPEAKRIALFGDSFSAGTYLQKNWPDQAEDLTRGGPRVLQLLNFSEDAGGLANWWSVMTRFVEPGNYDLDAVVFASYPGDLRRNFSFADGRGSGRVLLGGALSWDPATWPKDEQEARQQMTPSPGMYQISPQEFDRALRGEWQPRVDRSIRPKLPLAFRQNWQSLRAKYLEFRTYVGMNHFRSFDSGRQRLIAEMHHFLQQRHLPVMVVFVPSKPHLLGSLADREALEETRAFATLLGAEFVDGSAAFAGLTPEQTQAHWLPNDNHWNQLGSDRFAAFIVRTLEHWPDHPRQSR